MALALRVGGRPQPAASASRIVMHASMQAWQESAHILHTGLESACIMHMSMQV